MLMIFFLIDVRVQTKKVIGLDPTFSTLQSFVSAAGYAEAAALHNLTDPPFVQGTWGVAEFRIPEQPSSGANGTVVVPTTAIRSLSNCHKSDRFDLSRGGTQGSFAVTGTWQGCSASFNIESSATDQFGVTTASCGNDPADPFKAVVFWFYSPQAQTASLMFCQPTIQVFNVLAEAELNGDRKMLNVTLVDQNVAANNVTGAPQNGRAFNG